MTTAPAHTIFVDGNPCEFRSGETILNVARRNGIDIPTLCFLNHCSPTGACRICGVEVKGRPQLVASCATPAENGMQVSTSSQRIFEARRTIIQMLLSSGDHNCSICAASGACRLQDLAYEYKVDKLIFPAPKNFPPPETENPFIQREMSKCILCGRCVQACNERQVNLAIEFGYRGKKSAIIAGTDVPLKQSDCVFCGDCVQVCPVGALTEKHARFQGRPWEMTRTRTTCGYCGVGCQIDIHTKNNRVVKITGADVAPNYEMLCIKGRFAFDFIHHPDRLTTPLIRKNGAFRQATWDEALTYTAKRLLTIKKKYSPNAIGLLASARMTNEDNYIAQKFARMVIGTNHVDHCARLCHASTVAGLAAAFGSGAMTNPISDIPQADTFLVTGSNTTETHPVISAFIKQSIKKRNAKLIVADPRKIKLTEFSQLWLRQRPGTDVAWINGMIRIIIKSGWADMEFIQKRTEGFEELKVAVEEYTPEAVKAICGIPESSLHEAARTYAMAKAAAIYYCMGITQHTSGTDNVKALANLAMVCGHIGKPGTGVNPLRGQNNVQGACDMGALPNVYSGYQAVADAEVRDKMTKEWGASSLPDSTGWAATEMIQQADSGNLKALIVIGENPMVSEPDLNHTEKALAKLDFLVVQDIFLSDTAQIADVVFPALCFAEKKGTFTNTERRILPVHPAVRITDGRMPDWQILCALSEKMGMPLRYAGSEKILDEIAAVTPSYRGVSFERACETPLHWPCPSTGHSGTPRLHESGFPRGLGKFHPVEFRPAAETPDDAYPLILTTGRLLCQYHTGTMTRKSPDINEIHGECFVEISEEDARKYKVAHGEMVHVFSRRGKIKARVHVSAKAVQGTVFIPFHFAENAANRLTNAALDPVAKIPEFKVCAVTLQKIDSAL